MYKRSTVFLALALGMLAVLPTGSLAADAPHAGATAGGSAAAGGQGKQAAGGKIIVTGRSHVADSSGVGNANSRAYGQANGKYSKAKTGAKTVATVGAHLGKNGNAVVHAYAGAKAKAVAQRGGKAVVKLATPKSGVTAWAIGGLHPKAFTQAGGITKASAIVGVGASASGGKTIFKNLANHVRVAMSYTPTAYSVSIETSKTATAYSGMAGQGKSFKAGSIWSAAQMAAYAYATAGNNYAIGRAEAHSGAYAVAHSSSAGAESYTYASAEVYGKKQVVIVVAGKKIKEFCTWYESSHTLFCDGSGPKPTGW